MNFRPFKVYVKDNVRGFESKTPEEEDKCYPVLAIRETTESTELLLPNRSNKLAWVKMGDVTVCGVYPMK